MPAPPTIPWTELFASSALPDGTLELRAVKKSGRAFLFVPAAGSLATHALDLYPAQSRSAKLAKAFLKSAFRARLPLGLEKISTPLSSKDSFPRFLNALVEDSSGSLPPLAIFAGNPREGGCRFLMLLFDGKHRPAFVVKAGLGDSARQLIRHEAAFLHSASSGTPGLPLLRGSFDEGSVSAFALDFADGDSPGVDAGPALAELLGSWVNRSKQIQLRDTVAWRSLEKAATASDWFGRLSQKLATITFHPVLFHGDFAPWNIKVSPRARTWSVLDWERGELIGIPGWDWFHYIIQSAILVQKQTPDAILGKLEALLAVPEFQNYAGLSDIKGHERLLLIAYLSHLIAVIKPSEGLEANQSLLALLFHRWLS
jgi:hypothetical protein